MRPTQVFQVVIVTVFYLLVSSNCIASAIDNNLVGSDSNRNLLSFNDVDSRMIKHHVSSQASSIKEERSAAATVVGGAAAGNNGVVLNNQQEGGKTVTVTKYSNNGLWQKFKRWCQRQFGGVKQEKPSTKPRRLRLR
ncbi:hypothetical protein P3T76_005972 [Phytophthora citrophthora]|uniref:RxLR effector protein n=1 Tax=Phytophthora citrophthora TaxID=4793 RepID=A0AAD9LME1_9STRA|nr:hypothetical protein P3T76_005972 [Phytophthora citrophthora]